MSELKEKTVKSMIWNALDSFSIQGVQFLVMLFMARLLSPGDYGLVGMAAIFIAVSNSLIDSGFSQALIRKQERTEVDKSTVFYFNIVVSVLLYSITFVCAPLVADFYKMPLLADVIKVLCVVFFLNSLSVVQRAEFTAKLDFKSLMKASSIGAVVSGIAGVLMAWAGYGVWALVGQQIASAFITMVLLWKMSDWRPIKAFSWASFREMFSFGSKLMLSGLIGTIYKEIYPIVIGKLFSASDLGHYNRAKHFAQFPSTNLTNIMHRVSYPVLCQIQNEEERLRTLYRKFLNLSAFVVFPLMMILSALAIPLTNVLIGEKWLFCAQILQVVCFAMMWYPIHAINLNLLQVKGRSDLFLNLEIIKKILGVSMLFLTAPYGIMVMCYGQIVNSLLALIINTYFTGKLIDFGFFKQMKDYFPTLLLGLVMFSVVWGVTFIINNQYIVLVVGGLLGAVIYLGGSILFRFSELQDIKDMLLKRGKKNE